MKKDPKKKMNDTVRYFLTGAAMGSADIVPGVSGGTIAFIAGIYEQLIESIKTVTSVTLRLFLKGKIKESLQSVPFSFLIPLGLGLLTAVLTLSHALSYALVEFPVFIWSFFFGLIIGSVLIVKRRIPSWQLSDYSVLAISAFIAYIIVGIVPAETPATYPAFFISGSIAITAMILPGISGSFMLLIMGKYQQILEAVTQLDILTLGIFLSGAVVGISVFARVLSWLFKKHHNLMIAVLTGLMIGSLRKVWPWKETVQAITDRHGDLIPVVQRNILPPAVDIHLFIAIGLAVVGFALISQIDKNTPD